MVIDNTGKVGIGTTSPTQLLEVNGTVKASAFQGDGSGLTGISAGKWSDATGGINYTGGKVGIGKSSPSEMLDVNGNIKLLGDLKMAGTDSYIWTNGTGTGFTGIWDPANSKAALKYTEGSNLEFMSSKVTIKPDGSVGIGVTNPSSKLHVDDSNVEITTSGGQGMVVTKSI